MARTDKTDSIDMTNKTERKARTDWMNRTDRTNMTIWKDWTEMTDSKMSNNIYTCNLNFFFINSYLKCVPQYI